VSGLHSANVSQRLCRAQTLAHCELLVRKLRVNVRFCQPLRFEIPFGAIVNSVDAHKTRIVRRGKRRHMPSARPESGSGARFADERREQRSQRLHTISEATVSIVAEANRQICHWCCCRSKPFERNHSTIDCLLDSLNRSQGNMHLAAFKSLPQYARK
jgi:hypothetical protein